MDIFDNIIDFVRRHAFVVVVVALLIFAPSLLAGMVSVLFYVIMGAIVLAVILVLAGRWWLARKQREIYDRMFDGNRTAGGPGYGGRGDASRREGDVRVYKTQASPRKKVNGQVGDYVDFEDVKESERKEE